MLLVIRLFKTKSLNEVFGSQNVRFFLKNLVDEEIQNAYTPFESRYLCSKNLKI